MKRTSIANMYGTQPDSQLRLITILNIDFVVIIKEVVLR